MWFTSNIHICICPSKKYLLHSGMCKPNHSTLPTLVYTGIHQCAPLSPEGETLDWPPNHSFWLGAVQWEGGNHSHRSGRSRFSVLYCNVVYVIKCDSLPLSLFQDFPESQPPSVFLVLWWSPHCLAFVTRSYDCKRDKQKKNQVCCISLSYADCSWQN